MERLDLEVCGRFHWVGGGETSRIRFLAFSYSMGGRAARSFQQSCISIGVFPFFCFGWCFRSGRGQRSVVLLTGRGNLAL